MSRILYAFLLLLSAISGHAADWWQTAASPVTVFPANAAEWKITDQGNQPLTPTFAQVGGKQALVSGAQSVKLTDAATFGPDCEITIRFGLDPVEGKSAGLTATLASAGGTALPVSVSGTDGADAVQFNAAGVAGTLHLRGTYQRSLNYPDSLRRILENEMTTHPGLSERWLSIRYVLHGNEAELYVNDILVNTKTTDLPPSGALQLSLTPAVSLLAVQTRSLAARNPLYQPIRIDHRLNAAKIDGHAVQRAALPRPGEAVNVKNIPFVFPEPDRRGNDHLDVGVSRLQNGYMEENPEPQAGLLGGRWIGPLMENPTRLQFQVPQGRYRALHLIAAADSERDSTPVVTVQFFWPKSGRPESFSTRVPLLTARSTAAVPLPIRLDNGRQAPLYLVTIPIELGALAVFDTVGTCDLEITKEVKYFRAYPDPSQYSVHAAGLPSAVHVYAMTLERPAVALELQPDVLGHIWEAPNQPSYTVKLHNTSAQPRRVELTLATQDYNGKENTTQTAAVTVPANGEATQKFALELTRYGYHSVTLSGKDGAASWTERRALAYLRTDTRERGDWQPGRGPLFGFWNWAGAHNTLLSEPQYELMAKAGAEATMRATQNNPVAAQFNIKSYLFATAHWTTGGLMGYLDKPAEGEAWFIEEMKKNRIPASPSDRPEHLTFFAEPHLGSITTGIPPDYYGEDYELAEHEMAALRRYERAFTIGAGAIKKNWPEVKCLLPWGDPMSPVYFLRKSPEVRKLIDGTGVDISVFERLAENQLHQISIHRLYITREEFRKVGIKPTLAMYEGPFLSTRPGALTLKENADNWVRLDLLLYAHGVDQLLGGWGHEVSSYWGEQHYGGGIIDQVPLNTPKPAYAALATMTRHVNRKNLDKWLPTGSLSVYALQFKHYRSSALTHVFWTIRGKRPLTAVVPAGAVVTLYDQMDNATVLPVRDGAVTFTIDASPCFVEGLPADAQIMLGEPDHSDAAPAPATLKSVPSPQNWATSGQPIMSPVARQPVPQVSSKLANPGDGTWTLSPAEDKTYADNSYLMVARFPGVMTAKAVEAPVAQGGKAIAVQFGPQAKERKVMPFYTTLAPAKPIAIPGKASHLGLWVKAASDWGRVVYSLLDAEGERWVSVGTKDDWNCDDIYSWSYFCFDGWRYLRFEMPANSPYDRYREMGSTWWGHFGKGDGLVTLPLSLEKIIVERRTHAMYVNDPQPTRSDDVLLADLYAEYEHPRDRTAEVLRLAKLHMPVPAGMPELDNPIAALEKTGVGAPVTGVKITLPDQEADGTRCYVHFDTVPGAQSYDVWVSPYADGRGAFKLGSAWKAPGGLITGLRQDTDFYVFVAYLDADGKPSKPSAPLKIHLKDVFGMK
jgi:hypothetical protein